MEYVRGLPDDLPDKLPSRGEQAERLSELQDVFSISLHRNGILAKAQQELDGVRTAPSSEYDIVRPIIAVRPGNGGYDASFPDELIGIRFQATRIDGCCRGRISPFTPIARRLGNMVLPYGQADETYTDEDAMLVVGLVDTLKLERDTGLLPNLCDDLTRIATTSERPMDTTN